MPISFKDIVEKGLSLVDKSDLKKELGNHDIRFGISIAKKNMDYDNLENSCNNLNKELNIIKENKKKLNENVKSIIDEINVIIKD